MLEKDLAKVFMDIFREYQIWVPSNRSAGWPDRGVQISGSKIVWFELKMLPERPGATILINTLEKEQAAWLAKWQMRGGYCFLFLGITDPQRSQFVKYGVLRCGSWNTWLKVPYQPVRLDQILMFDNRGDIMIWFKDTFIPQTKVGGRPSNAARAAKASDNAIVTTS